MPPKATFEGFDLHFALPDETAALGGIKP